MDLENRCAPFEDIVLTRRNVTLYSAGIRGVRATGGMLGPMEGNWSRWSHGECGMRWIGTESFGFLG